MLQNSLTIKSQIRIAIFSSVLVFGLFFSIQNAGAAATEALNCCVSYKDNACLTSDVKSCEDWAAIGCRIVEESTECDTVGHTELIDGFHRGFREGSVPCNGIDKEGRFYGEAFLCYFSNENIRKTLEALGQLGAAKCDQYKTVNECNTGVGANYCFWSNRLNECVSKTSGGVCPYFNETECRKSQVCKWEDDVCNTPLESELKNIYGERDTGLLPPCTALGTCRDVNQILEVVVNFTREVFKYIGALAFVFFIYGGGLMVFSFGNAEKFKKGQSVLVAAVIGLIIAFSAYFMVGFLLDLLGGVG